MPCPRKGHAMVYCGVSNSIYIFGGMGTQRQLLNDLWRLRMDTYEWTQVGVGANILGVWMRATLGLGAQALPFCTEVWWGSLLQYVA